MKLSAIQNRRGLWQWVIEHPNGRYALSREFGTEKAAMRAGRRILKKTRLH